MRRFSQNFLIDRNILDKVIKTAAVAPHERIFEIGPGKGFITRRLLEEGASVVAVEIDKKLIPDLQQLPIELIEGDFMKMELPSADKVVSNIPYKLTSPILGRLLPFGYKTLTLFCQDEVARRIVAQPNSRDYGALTLFVQFYATVRYAFKVPRNCFRPVPKVDSAVVHFVHKKPPSVNPEKFFAFVHAAFQGRRKKVATTWRKKYNLHIESDARPENLSLDDFLKYFHALPQADRE